MKEGFFLHYLINVYNVYPTFLLPIFSNGNMLFFQNSKDSIIESFTEADLSEFSKMESKIIHQKSVTPHFIGKKTVYSIAFSAKQYAVGTNVYISNYLNSNKKLVETDEHFLKYVQYFYKDQCDLKKEKVLINSHMLILENIIGGESYILDKNDDELLVPQLFTRPYEYINRDIQKLITIAG